MSEKGVWQYKCFQKASKSDSILTPVVGDFWCRVLQVSIRSMLIQKWVYLVPDLEGVCDLVGKAFVR